MRRVPVIKKIKKEYALQQDAMTELIQNTVGYPKISGGNCNLVKSWCVVIWHKKLHGHTLSRRQKIGRVKNPLMTLELTWRYGVKLKNTNFQRWMKERERVHWHWTFSSHFRNSDVIFVASRLGCSGVWCSMFAGYDVGSPDWLDWVIDGMFWVSLSVEREGKTGSFDSTQPLLSSLVLTNCQSTSEVMSRQKHQVILTDTRVCSHDGENLCLVSVVDAPSQMVCVCPKTSRDNGGSFFSQASCWRGLVRLCYLIGRLSWDVFFSFGTNGDDRDDKWRRLR